MTQVIPAELHNLFPGAKPVGFGDIRKGDTVASFENGRLLVGVAHEQVGSDRCWLTKGDRVVAYEDESILLINRPERPRPTAHKSLIRLTKPLAGTVLEANLYARMPTGEWWPVGYSGSVRPDSDFADVEWEEVFITKEKPSE